MTDAANPVGALDSDRTNSANGAKAASTARAISSPEGLPDTTPAFSVLFEYVLDTWNCP
jgi:hypothetical protein